MNLIKPTNTLGPGGILNNLYYVKTPTFFGPQMAIFKDL